MFSYLWKYNLKSILQIKKRSRDHKCYFNDEDYQFVKKTQIRIMRCAPLDKDLSWFSLKLSAVLCKVISVSPVLIQRS